MLRLEIRVRVRQPRKGLENQGGDPGSGCTGRRHQPWHGLSLRPSAGGAPSCRTSTARRARRPGLRGRSWCSGTAGRPMPGATPGARSRRGTRGAPGAKRRRPLRLALGRLQARARTRAALDVNATANRQRSTFLNYPPRHHSDFLKARAPGLPSSSQQHPLPHRTPTATPADHHPLGRVPQQFDHELLRARRVLPHQHPHFPPSCIPHHAPGQRRMLHRHAPFGIPALEALVLPVHAPHAHIAPDEPQIAPVAPRADARAPERAHVRVAHPCMLSPQRTLTATKKPLGRHPGGIGFGPHARTSGHLQACAEPLTAEHPPPRQQWAFEVFDGHGHPHKHFDAWIMSRHIHKQRGKSV